ncbi:hypothetical protein BD779DRAFT_1676113 [Infundibulicybe gibba]|nr:hypothetical protein BD779DRAFT_1676113 [Infundibulicybe gibba]
MPSDADVAQQTSWRSIRPWTPPLSLVVREITSVSATFILSSNVSDVNGDLEPSLMALGLLAVDDQPDPDEANGSPGAAERKRRTIISDALAKGLSVNVNGSPWQRVFIRIDDKLDEAVIIIYGLMPGRQYDIELGLVQDGQNNIIHRQVVTEDPPEPEVPEFERSISDGPATTPSTSPAQPSPSTPTKPPLTLEDRLNQLQHTLTSLNTERDLVSAQLKSARRDAQKADAALRSEIDILKRALEKSAAAEHRVKQKILALQEAFKRAHVSTREIEEMVTEVEAEVPAIHREKAEREEAYARVKEEADRVREERDREAEKERKALEIMKGELTGLNNKLERLNGKKDKLETSVIPDLEEQLREIKNEIERTEADPFAYQLPAMPPDDSDALPYIPAQRARTSAGTIGRPSPIQRPTHQTSSSAGPHLQHTPGPQLWSPHGRAPAPPLSTLPPRSFSPTRNAGLLSSLLPLLPPPARRRLR